MPQGSTQTVEKPTANAIALTVGGRIYGDEVAGDRFAHLREMTVPKELDALVDALHAKSELLKLATTSSAEAIHRAYGTDLAMLTKYRNAFQQTLAAAVRARADETHIDAQAFLANVAAQIGQIDHNPKLDLDQYVLQLDPPARLARLQTDFKGDVDELKQALVIWLHAMTENDIVSVIEWIDGGKTAAKYHFIRMESARDAKSTVHDPGMNLRGRHVTTKTETKVEVFSERRSHTVVDAKSHALDAYTRRVPQRIARLVDSIPAEVRPFVTIIDGNLSKEEVHRKTEASRTEVTEKSVWVDDPTPALFGTWALGGWGGTTNEASNSLYSGHALSKANLWLVVGLALTALAGAMTMPLGGSRIAGLVVLVCAALVLFSQIGMRIGESRSPQAA